MCLSHQWFSGAIICSQFLWQLEIGKSNTQIMKLCDHKRKMNSSALQSFHLQYYTLTGPVRTLQTVARNQPSVQRATREDRTTHSSGSSSTRTHRRAPQSSSGPRQPERASAGAPLLERRRQHHTKPQSDQRNRNTPKLSKKTYILHF